MVGASGTGGVGGGGGGKEARGRERLGEASRVERRAAAQRAGWQWRRREEKGDEVGGTCRRDWRQCRSWQEGGEAVVAETYASEAKAIKLEENLN